MAAAIVTTPMTDLFRVALRQSFEDLDIPDRGAASYLADLLARFAVIAALHPRGVAGARLESVADRLGEIQRVWQPESPYFAPEREVELRRDLADWTLFMSGFFWEHARGAAVSRHWVRQGKRAYRFLAAYHRAHGRPAARLFRCLARRFEIYAAVLSYMRDVHLGARFAPRRERVVGRS